MTEAKSLLEARKKAEEAVADMAAGDLKTKAFELILNRLLSAMDDLPAERQSRRRNQDRTERKPQGKEVGSFSGSAPARILQLKTQNFFDDPRGIGQIREELQTHGWHYNITSLSGTLMKLVRAGELRRQKVKDGAKTIYKYFNP